MSNILDMIGDIIELAEAHKGTGWRASSIETYRYKDTGEVLWSINMVNTHRLGGPGEDGDRLLVSVVAEGFMVKSVQKNIWPVSHYRNKSSKQA